MIVTRNFCPASTVPMSGKQVFVLGGNFRTFRKKVRPADSRPFKEMLPVSISWSSWCTAAVAIVAEDAYNYRSKRQSCHQSILPPPTGNYTADRLVDDLQRPQEYAAAAAVRPRLLGRKIEALKLRYIAKVKASSNIKKKRK
ncbi:hypothetical protein CERZMDRAFT_84604 [Cercospora zeae-maydis SCOH1-5]|uniref:Uncharacterized protein n=1 Tax=Cercospora zeae-maydis SCOH1-5 TaxID=717836 RepID=A0A6A6FFY6_9PEZI|nr:hypothetical protein CERZMDRAFT_84604 [Cercospora zeae-maydis SCOH1-5]